MLENNEGLGDIQYAQTNKEIGFGSDPDDSNDSLANLNENKIY